jgi:hypothetical protein
MPWVEEEDGWNKVQDIGREHRDNDVSERFLFDQSHKHVSWSTCFTDSCLDADDSNPDSSKHHVDHEQSKENEWSNVSPLWTLWTITHSQDEL